MHPMQPCEGVASGRKIAQRGKWRRRRNGSPTKRRKANSSHTQTIACVHQNATERNRSEIELPRHVKVRGTDIRTAVRACHTKRRSIARNACNRSSPRSRRNRRQRYRRRHRHAADPDHHRQHMQCASQNDVIHNCTGKTVRPNSDIQFLPRLVVDAFVLEQILPQFGRRRYYSRMVAPSRFLPKRCCRWNCLQVFPRQALSKFRRRRDTSFGQRDADIQSR